MFGDGAGGKADGRGGAPGGVGGGDDEVSGGEVTDDFVEVDAEVDPVGVGAADGHSGGRRRGVGGTLHADAGGVGRREGELAGCAVAALDGAAVEIDRAQDADAI